MASFFGFSSSVKNSYDQVDKKLISSQHFKLITDLLEKDNDGSTDNQIEYINLFERIYRELEVQHESQSEYISDETRQLCADFIKEVYDLCCTSTTSPNDLNNLPNISEENKDVIRNYIKLVSMDKQKIYDEINKVIFTAEDQYKQLEKEKENIMKVVIQFQNITLFDHFIGYHNYNTNIIQDSFYYAVNFGDHLISKHILDFYYHHQENNNEYRNYWYIDINKIDFNNINCDVLETLIEDPWVWTLNTLIVECKKIITKIEDQDVVFKRCIYLTLLERFHDEMGLCSYIWKTNKKIVELAKYIWTLDSHENVEQKYINIKTTYDTYNVNATLVGILSVSTFFGICSLI